VIRYFRQAQKITYEKISLRFTGFMNFVLCPEFKIIRKYNVLEVGLVIEVSFF
jgi:hypothetical protein